MKPLFDDTVPPERVGPYRIDRSIGRGGMGTVWRAWDERLMRQVAIKQIRADSPLQTLQQRLWREAQAAARLNHPAIVHVYDLVEDEAGAWIVMELVAGHTLRDVVDECGPLPFAQAVRLGLDIAEGLAEAHSHGILHRDLKAANVMVTPAGRAKILDFGLAKQIGSEDREASITRTGVVIGTCYAMSPEQVMGRDLDARSDLFSLGSLLYEILTGEPPFQADLPAASMALILSHQPPPVEKVRSGIPRDLSFLVSGLLEKEPRDRPQTAREVAGILAGMADRDSEAPTAVEPVLARRTTTAPRGTSSIDRSSERRRSIGEQRLLTVVCCGLIRLGEAPGETGYLDPEDLSDAMATLQALAGEVCERTSGQVGATLGHRLWLYFGYPQAREDDAQRAVQAARELAARSGEIGPNPRTAFRAAVHTGHAVVSIRGGQEASLQPGPLLDLTAGLQDQASPGEILVTAASRSLIARAFATEDLPAVRLPGSEQPVAISRVLEAMDARQEGDDPLTPLVGREREADLLLDRYHLAHSGHGQAVMVSGEPGIGKSRLLKELRERLSLSQDSPSWWIAYGSLADQGSPLAPVLDLLERMLFGAETTSPERKLDRLEEFLAAHGAAPSEVVPLLAPLLGLPFESRYPHVGAHPKYERKKLFEALVSLLAEIADRRPLALVVEDLHWADPSTLELLGLLLEEITSWPMLLVATFRPEFQAPWGHRANVTQLNLSRLTEEQATALIDRLTEGNAALPTGLRQQILEKTDGVPLFVEELTKALLETGRTGGLAEIPTTLSGSLTARLDRPGPAKEVAQVASVIGRTFSPHLLETIAPLDAEALQQGLDELIQAELVHRRGVGPRARYSFKHALIQDAAYASLLSRDRQELHLKIAEALEAEASEAGLLAHHWARAVSPRNPEPSLVRRAVPRLLAAGEHTQRLGAYQEARGHLESALALVRTLPEGTERDEQELPLLVLLCRTLQASLGYTAPEVQGVYDRARELGNRLGDRREISQILYMLWVSRIFDGDFHQALELASEWLEGARRSGRGLLSAHGAMSHSFYFLGRLTECLHHAETVLAFPPTEQEEALTDYGLPPRVGAAYYSAWALVHLGMEKEALARHDLAVELAEKHADPFGMAMALGASITFHIRRHDLPAVLSTAEKMKRQAVELGIPGEESLADRARTWALAEQGDPEALRDFLSKSASRKNRMNGKLERGWACHQIGMLFLRLGKLEEAGVMVQKGLAAAREGEHLVEPHLVCLKGELLLALGDLEAGEAALREAFKIACEGLQAPVAERALSRLAPLLASQGRQGETTELRAQGIDLAEKVSERVQEIFVETERDPVPAPPPRA